MFIPGAVQGGGSRSKEPNSLMSFRKEVFISKPCREGCRGSDLPLIVWWGGTRVGFQESQSSAFWFQPAWGPCACAQPEVTNLPLGGGLSS